MGRIRAWAGETWSTVVTVVCLALVIVLASLTGCAAKPRLPEKVTVVVEKYRPLPAWATNPLPRPEPSDGTVGARVESHHARGLVIDTANCARKLLKALDAGQKVTKNTCQ